MPKPSSSLDNLKGQPMFQILELCRQLEKQGKYILHFELGDPDFDTPQLITESCIQSLKSGNTHYMPARGSSDLIEAVRMTTGISRGFIPTRNQITVTTGANSAIFYAFKAICDMGDQILIPNPYFPSYLAACEIAGAKPVLYSLRPDEHFIPQIDDLEKLVNHRTKALLINSPANPTGSVLPIKAIELIYQFAKKHDLFIISDEVYARMIYEESCKFSSPSSFDSCLERTIVINGFSKAFAMTGWRVGVVIAPHDVSTKITLISESIVSCVPGFIQDGARAAILCPISTTEKMYSTYRKRQLNICSQLASAGLEITDPPQGAMYVFPSIKKFANDSEKFAKHILKHSGIATVPGIYFGSQGEGHLRFSCAGSDQDIEKLGYSFRQAAMSYKGG
jgi:aspartate aminotransferase